LDTPHTPYSPLTDSILGRIRKAVGEKALILDACSREEFGRDATGSGCLPEAVVEATTAEQVVALMRLANELQFPVTPRGTGTGLAGGSIPVSGGVVLSLARMNRIMDIDPGNLVVLVEPGVINGDLKKAARELGLFYPPDPASFDTCSLGGNAATNAGGASCVKYGTTRDYVLGLDAVLPNGELIRTGVQTRKGVVGYDLTRLLVGSEGTLGVITRLVLKLLPLPPAVMTLVALFPDLPSAMHAVMKILSKGYAPCALEFLDRHCLDLVGDLLPFDGVREAGAFLLVEADGAPRSVAREIEEMGEVCLESGAGQAFLAPDAVKRARMWDVRKEVSLRIERGASIYVPEDVVVPLGRIAELVEGLPELEDRFGVRIYAFGHAGDGNIHLNITSRSPGALAQVQGAIEAVLDRVLALGGTISGEHGIGLVKKRFMAKELCGESLRVQREIKRVFDPGHILNPGKLFE
jgi:D-lactate dehydrogenase (cytochrome)